MRMWYNGRTSAFQADDVSSILIIRSNIVYYRLPTNRESYKEIDVGS